MNKAKEKVCVVGAGFSGAVVAHHLANRGYLVDVYDSRDHVAGNCHTYRDSLTGVMIHAYGPHIFHTSNEQVWKYINQFDEFVPFINRVKAVSNNKVYSLPINLLTINNFFNKNLSPIEAEMFMKEIGDHSISNPQTFEEQALKFVGSELYVAFFRDYTKKQWGVEPSKLPASILKRLPIRFNYDDNYYTSRYQGIPKNGYTYIVEKMLQAAGITVILGEKFSQSKSLSYGHVFYSGPIDAWFNFEKGYLNYRTLNFEIERQKGDFQGNAVINYCDLSVPWTRISEHKHFSPWETHENTVIYREYSDSCIEGRNPYYPIRTIQDKLLLSEYISLAKKEKNVTFLGRLGTYRYLDMHVTIAEALDLAEEFINSRSARRKMKVFLSDSPS